MSDNQVTEPIETACFCKHGNLGQHESDCPKCPLHFTRGELNALQRERDQLRADLNASNQYGEHWHKQACDADSKHYNETIAHAKTKTELKQLRADLTKVREENATLTAELEQAREAIHQVKSARRVFDHCATETCVPVSAIPLVQAYAARLAAKTEK